nr:hypothetical protein VITISV_032771 [Ipomoea trifida]
MAGGGGGRSLEETPTWAVAAVCFVLVAISIVIEYVIHLIGKLLQKRNKKALYEALEKIKAELMLLGFISLLLTIGQSTILRICISKSLAKSWHPCDKHEEEDKYGGDTGDEGRRRRLLLAFADEDSGEIHRRILAGGGTDKCAKEIQKDLGLQGTPPLVEDTLAFGVVLHFFFGLQFVRSVPKVDYMTLRHGFIIAHLAPQSQLNFDFQQYIKRSLEEDFKVVVGISPPIWLFAVIFLLFNTHARSPLTCRHAFLSMVALHPTRDNLASGDKASGDNNQDGVEDPRKRRGGEGNSGVISVLVLLSQNAFQLAFFAWAWYEFGLKSCFHEKTEDLVIRISMGVLIQVLCSYVTLPLYALVTQMGSNMKPTIFNERVAKALKSWHQTARKQLRQNRHSGSVTPLSSRPGTPLHGTSPIHLLQYYRSEIDSVGASPARASAHDIEDNLPWSNQHREVDQPEENRNHLREPQPLQREIEMESAEFSFEKRER